MRSMVEGARACALRYFAKWALMPPPLPQRESRSPSPLGGAGWEKHAARTRARCPNPFTIPSAALPDI